MPYAPTHEIPLLPFERQLIDAIGITEEEYKYFKAYVRNQSKTRPAAYAHIPEIVNGPSAGLVVAIVSLVVGLASTAVSLLLRPELPSLDRQVRQRRGANQIGRDRFTQSAGFESAAELAAYGTVVPVAFGRYEEGTGGIVLAPQLVWSRMLSWNSYQIAKNLYVVAEAALPIPNKPGIFIGNTALDALPESDYAFYWRGEEGDNRIKGSDLRYGTRGERYDGDPGKDSNADGEVFVCPVKNEPYFRGFSNAYTPSNNTNFGVYSGLANGTPWKLNWKVISIPQVSDTDEAGGVGRAQRQKIAGKLADAQEDTEQGGMPGVGRGYSRRMGVIGYKHPNQDWNYPVNPTLVTDIKEKTATTKGTIIKYRLSKKAIGPNWSNTIKGKEPKDFKIDVKDVNGSVKALREQADADLQVGAKYRIGRCTFQVIKRDDDIWSTSNTVDVQLECVEARQPNTIGIAGSDPVELRDTLYEGGPNFASYYLEPSYYPLCRVDYGVVRNLREPEVTEIGIRSQVWNRAEGLCNFNEVPDPATLRKWDQDDINFTSGVMQKYMRRTSVFAIHFREVSVTNQENEWKLIPITFCVVGTKPVDQYNYIRIIPQTARRYEYRFVPKTSADIVEFHSDNDIFYSLRLDAPRTTVTAGDFSIVVDADQLKRNDILPLVELTTSQDLKNTLKEVKTSVPKDVDLVSYPKATSSSQASIDEAFNLRQAYYDNFLGPSESVFPGTSASAQITDIPNKPVGGTKNITIKLTAKVVEKVETYNSWTIYDVDINTPYSQSSWPIRQLYWNGVLGDTPSSWISTVNNIAQQNGMPPWEQQTLKAQKINWLNQAKKLFITVNGVKQYAIKESSTVQQNVNGVDVFFRVAAYPTFLDNSNTLYWDILELYVPRYQYLNNQLRRLPYAEMFESNDIDKPKIKNNFGYQNKPDPGNGQGWDIGVDLGDDEKADVIKGVFSKNDGTFIHQTTFNGTQYSLLLKVQVEQTKDYSRTDIVTGQFITNYWDLTKVDYVDSSGSWKDGEEFVHLVNTSYSNNIQFVYKIDGLKTITQLVVDDKGKRNFERHVQVNEVHFFDEISSSTDNGPEHEIVYVNECMRHPQIPGYTSLAMMGLSIKSLNGFRSLDQIRCWIPDGVRVRNFGGDGAENLPINDLPVAASNNFADLVYYLLTNPRAGLGNVINSNLINTTSFHITARYLRAIGFHFDGVISDRVNIREFLTDIAPLNLCNFVIENGQFALYPALPYDDQNAINVAPLDVPFGGGAVEGAFGINIAGIFTEGNIIENSFSLEYLDADSRRLFQSVVKYRVNPRNTLPEERTVVVRWADDVDASAPLETFDLTQFCTNREQAITTAKFMMSVRRRVDHVVSFKTTPNADISIAPNNYIRVITQSNPNLERYMGVINLDGTITALADVNENDQFDAAIYAPGSDLQENVAVVLQNGIVQNQDLWGSVFVRNVNGVQRQNVYQIEEVTLDEDGLVNIRASFVPTQADGSSLIANEVRGDGAFVVSVD